MGLIRSLPRAFLPLRVIEILLGGAERLSAGREASGVPQGWPEGCAYEGGKAGLACVVGRWRYGCEHFAR
jgi:hypothetical protein